LNIFETVKSQPRELGGKPTMTTENVKISKQVFFLNRLSSELFLDVLK
jgi:hypothetical protein